MIDPFHEHSAIAGIRRRTLLGGLFEFQSDSSRLLRLVDAAYDGVPGQRIGRRGPKFVLKMVLRDGGARISGREPPVLRTQAGAGLICGAIDAHNYVVLCPQLRRGLVSVSREMLRFPYHARYELLEFAVFTLATRAQGLVPLHAACVGANGRALLLVGESGAGKSTLTLQCMLQGMELLAEDAVFIEPASSLATGVPNFLHLRRNSLRFIGSAEVRAHARNSPVIRRRSGVAKVEVDLRQRHYRIASRAMKVAGIIFVTTNSDAGSAPLIPVDRSQARARLEVSQAYAAGLPSWKPFMASLRQTAAFELRRGRSPRELAQALMRLLKWGGPGG